MKRTLLLFSLVFAFSFRASAILPDMVDSIPMWDGKKLAADIYLSPVDPQAPTILIQTPYLRVLYHLGLPLGLDQSMAGFPYNIVIVDWRCFGGSMSACVQQPDRGKDGKSCVDWIAQQSWSDGQVGTWGPSALGKVQFLTAVENPAALKCMVPLVAAPQYDYLEYYPGGVLRTEYLEQLDQLGFGLSALVMPNQVENFVWQYLQNTTNFPDSILVPALMVGGWYDHNIETMLGFFNGLRTQSPVSVQNEHRLLMGPWAHGGSGTAQVGTATQGQLQYNNAAGWSDSLALAFFDYHLRGIQNNWNNTPFVQYYQMGENQWQTSAVWPPAGLTNYNLYLQPDTTLDVAMPGSSTGSISYSYDPLDPSPTIGGATLRPDLDQGPFDQAPQVESRNDVLVFNSPVLTQDVALKGIVQAHLKIASDHPDTDFNIRLTDVYPDGRSMLVQTGVRRMRSRNGYTAADTSLITPNQVYDCVIDLPSTCITFLAGHRIRVDISSSNYPQYNRNANSGGLLYPGLSPDSLQNPQTAVNTVYTNSVNASYITFPLISYPLAAGDIQNVQPALAVLPNPSGASAQLSITLPEADELQVELRDLSGKLVWKNSSAHNFRHLLNLPADIAPGVYFVYASGSFGRTQTVKWIKQ
ncbi:MAG: acylase and diesterase [Bacteroidetes bacterium]|nr:MAG: acylase and diesterase [Bacteroidota bacterium]